MAKRSRPTSKKRDREMVKKQKQQDKAERLAARREGRATFEDEPEPSRE